MRVQPRTKTPTVAPKQADEPDKTAEDAPAGKCNVPGCRLTPTNRGLCDAHWASRRGDATWEKTQ